MLKRTERRFDLRVSSQLLGPSPKAEHLQRPRPYPPKSPTAGAVLRLCRDASGLPKSSSVSRIDSAVSLSKYSGKDGRWARAMKDYQAQLEKLRTDAAECALIRDLATDKAKRELFDRLANHLTVLAQQVEMAMLERRKDAGP